MPVLWSLPVRASRIPIFLALFTALFAGSAPWRVCAHADSDHAHVWLPDAVHAPGAPHEHADPCGAHAPHRCAHAHAHAHAHPGAHPDRGDVHGSCPLGHVPGCPTCPEQGECHCGDTPLVTGAPLAPVSLAPHACVGRATTPSACLQRLGASEVAPSEPPDARTACEEDLVVLLR